MAEMSKSPEEIKKGLEAPIGIHYHDDPEPRLTPRVLAELIWLHDDAIALIQQLEANDSQVKKALQDNGFGSLEEFLQAFSQVKAERDALEKELAKSADSCCVCKNKYPDSVTESPCAAANYDCSTCEAECSCRGCYLGSRFAWRGLPEPPKEE